MNAAFVSIPVIKRVFIWSICQDIIIDTIETAWLGEVAFGCHIEEELISG